MSPLDPPAKAPSTEDLASHLARNLRDLRDSRGLSQTRLAELAGIPRATWSHLESGAANPTLGVLSRVAAALRVGIEELVAPPRSRSRLYKSHELPTRGRGKVQIRQMLPDPLPGLHIERMRLGPGARFSGSPHTRGTREYLTCERGQLVLTVEGRSWTLDEGDVLVFRGDQKHGYANPGGVEAVGWSVILVA